MTFFRGGFRTGNFSVHRLEALSDGVFSIVMTLLILEIRLPPVSGYNVSAELIGHLRELFPKFLSYVMSFAYLSVYWVNHHQLFHVIKRSDRGLFWFNSLFLMFLAFIPFPTALIGEYPHEPAAVIFYGLAMMTTAVSFLLMKWYVYKWGRLIDSSIEHDFEKISALKIWAGPVLYFAAIGTAFFCTTVSILIYILIPVIYFFPSEGEKRLANERRMA